MKYKWRQRVWVKEIGQKEMWKSWAGRNNQWRTKRNVRDGAESDRLKTARGKSRIIYCILYNV